MSNTNFNWVSPPGQSILTLLQKKQRTLDSFTDQINLSEKNVEALLNGNRAIDEVTAERLELILEVPKKFWLIRQKKYQENKDRILEDENRNWIKELPINHMLSMNWISTKSVDECLQFFDVEDVFEWRRKYYKAYDNLKFKKSEAFELKFSSLFAWVRQGEIVCEKINCSKWNVDKLENSLDELKKLTRLNTPKKFIPKLIDICSQCGVAITFLKTPNKCPVHGITKFINTKKAMILLSFRYLSDDHFWFTFFHEIGHLILHSKDGDKTFFEVDKVDDNIEEKEANLFAQELLVPHTYDTSLRNLKSNKRKIIALASTLGISPGILVGQMQKKGIINFGYLNSYKRRFNWSEISESLY